MDNSLDFKVQFSRVSELDLWQIELRHLRAAERSLKDPAITLHHTVQSKPAELKQNLGAVPPTREARTVAAFKKIAELVRPMLSFHSLRVHHAAAASANSSSLSNLSGQPSFVWTVEPSGAITIRDMETGVPMQTILRAKGNVMPSCLRHIPYYGAFVRGERLPRAPVHFDASSARQAVLQTIVSTYDEDFIPTDFVWIGFQDGSIRLIVATGNTLRSPQEGEHFLVSELPKHHAAEVVSVELSPYHPAKSSAMIDPALDRGLGDTLDLLASSTTTPEDRYIGYVCTASADSCIVVWDLLAVYADVDGKKEAHRRLNLQNKFAASYGPKASRGPSYVDGMKQGTETTAIFTHQMSDSESLTLTSHCISLAVRPVFKLKGSINGLRQLRWVSTIITTEKNKKASVKSSRKLFHPHSSMDDDDGRPQKPLIQTQTRAEARESNRNSLGLSEEEMENAEAARNDLEHFDDTEEEPLQTRCVHLLTAGDARGFVLMWNLNEELNRNAASEIPKLTQKILDQHAVQQHLSAEENHNHHHLHHQSEKQHQGGSPKHKRPFVASMSILKKDRAFDEKSRATHTTVTSSIVRSTDKRILFSGGVPICGLEPVLPPIIRITLRCSESEIDEDDAVRSAFLTPAKHARPTSRSNRFRPLTDQIAMFHMFSHLEFFVGVDGTVQFLTCHPLMHNEDSYANGVDASSRYLEAVSSTSPNRILSRRRDTDDIVGSLDFATFSVFFSKRILEYHSQPITTMRRDDLREELWVARHDGMLACFDTKLLYIKCRIPHPWSNVTTAPPHHDELEVGFQDYRHLAGLPTHLDHHPECLDYPKSYFSVLLPCDTERGERLLAVFGDSKNHISDLSFATNVAESHDDCLWTWEEAMADRLRRTQLYRQKRLLEKESEKSRVETLDRELRDTSLAFERQQEKMELIRRCQRIFFEWKSRCHSCKERRVQEKTESMNERVKSEDEAALSLQRTEWRDAQLQRQSTLAETSVALRTITDTVFVRSRFLHWLAVTRSGIERKFNVTAFLDTRANRMGLRSYFNVWLAAGLQALRQHRLATAREKLEQFLIQTSTNAKLFYWWNQWKELAAARRAKNACSSLESVFSETAEEKRDLMLRRKAWQRWIQKGARKRVVESVSILQAVVEAAVSKPLTTPLQVLPSADATLLERQHIEQMASSHVLELENQVTRHFSEAMSLLGSCIDANWALGLELGTDGADRTLQEVLSSLAKFEEHRVVIATGLESHRCDCDTEERKASQYLANKALLLDTEAYVHRELVRDQTKEQGEFNPEDTVSLWRSFVEAASTTAKPLMSLDSVFDEKLSASSLSSPEEAVPQTLARLLSNNKDLQNSITPVFSELLHPLLQLHLDPALLPPIAAAEATSKPVSTSNSKKGKKKGGGNNRNNASCNEAIHCDSPVQFRAWLQSQPVPKEEDIVVSIAYLTDALTELFSETAITQQLSCDESADLRSLLLRYTE